jgi:hypothetical protein
MTCDRYDRCSTVMGKKGLKSFFSLFYTMLYIFSDFCVFFVTKPHNMINNNACRFRKGFGKVFGALLTNRCQAYNSKVDNRESNSVSGRACLVFFCIQFILFLFTLYLTTRVFPLFSQCTEYLPHKGFELMSSRSGVRRSNEMAS